MGFEQAGNQWRNASSRETRDIGAAVASGAGFASRLTVDECLARRAGVAGDGGPLVEVRGDLRDLSAQLPGFQRRWRRRPERYREASGLPRGPRDRCHLAHALLSLPARRLRLRRQRLRERGSTVWDAG